MSGQDTKAFAHKDHRLFLKHDRVFKKDDRVLKKRGGVGSAGRLHDKIHHFLLRIHELRPWCWLCM